MKKNNKFLLITVVIVIIVCAVLITSQKGKFDFSISFKNHNQSYTYTAQGTQDINIKGVVEYQEKGYKYAGTFKEVTSIISLHENGQNEDEVKRASSGLIIMEYNANPITFRIDYTDNENVKLKRDYVVQIEYGKIKKTINKTVSINNSQIDLSNPIYKLDLADLLKESGVFK